MGGQDEPSELYRVSMEGGPVEPVIQTVRRALYAAPMPDGSVVFSANPSTVDLGLWWRPASGGDPQPLTTGLGEHAETYLSADGRRAVSTLLEVRQSLVQISVQAGDATAARRLTDGYTGDLYPHFDPMGRRLVFSSSRGGNRNLWLARPDATQPSLLTSDAASDDRPAFSPNGDQIAFVSGRGGQQGIWIVSADGGTPTLIAPASVLDTLTWSPDGKRIFFSTPGDKLPHLAAVSVDNGHVEPFLPTVAGHSPSWSGATNRLAYLDLDPPTASTPSRTSLAIVDGGTRRVYPNPGIPQGFASGLVAWSPDGRRLAVTAAQANTRVSIWIVEPDAPAPFRRLVELPVTVRVRGMAWTPDGSSLVVAEQESKSDIVLFDIANHVK
jgi:Tol biopolymer transport system component